jgi:hypothetical protein
MHDLNLHTRVLEYRLPNHSDSTCIIPDSLYFLNVMFLSAGKCLSAASFAPFPLKRQLRWIELSICNSSTDTLMRSGTVSTNVGS